MNEAAIGWIKAYIRLRQGDPISFFFFFFFTIITNVSSRMLLREKGLFEGFLASRNRIRVSLVFLWKICKL